MPYRNRAAWRDDLSLGAPETTSNASDALADPGARAHAARIVAGGCSDAGECRRFLEILGLSVADARRARTQWISARPAG